MRVEQNRWSANTGWVVSRADADMAGAQLVLFFAARDAFHASRALSTLRASYPVAHLVGCSTAGEICDTSVNDGTVVATAILFEHTRVRASYRRLDKACDSRTVGSRVAQDLAGSDLVHVFVLAEGLNVNGSELVAALRDGLPETVALTGGLAGDGSRFERTSVYFDDEPEGHAVAAIGLYGDRIRVGYGSMGGWDQFGPDRVVARSEANVLYECDGESALSLYKKYLGPHAATLPASGLLFPLSLRGETGDQRVVRTILGIDEDAGSLVFAGDIPQGAYVSLMRANVDRLIDGAHGAAAACVDPLTHGTASLALLISCVGRKLVLKQRTEEEVENVRDVLGPDVVLSGFYSYGEIAPFSSSAKCELHNQTMTITTFTER